MNYKLWGNTGLRVSSLCLGSMTFGQSWGFGADEISSKRIIDKFIDVGGNFIDTANVYTNGESEIIVGKAISGKRDKIVLSTKYSLCTDNTDPNSLGNGRKNLRTSVENSLKRLGTDYIDFLWVHAWYFENKPEDVVRALDDLVRSGKILYWGLSDTPAWVCAESKAIAEIRGYSPLSAIQFEYSLIERTAEREIIPFANKYNIGQLGWAPLAGGILSGKHYSAISQDVDSLRIDRANNRKTTRNEMIEHQLVTFAHEAGITPAQLAIKWLLSRDGAFVPIIGARTVEQLNENIATLDVEVDNEIIEKLTTISSIDMGFPDSFYSTPRSKFVMYGPYSK